MNNEPEITGKTRREFLKFGGKLAKAAILSQNLPLSGLLSQTILPTQYKAQLKDVPTSKLIFKIDDLVEAFSWDSSESMFSERERYSHHHTLLADVSITLREEQSGTIFPEHFELMNVSDANLEKVLLLIRACKDRGGEIIKFIKTQNPDKMGDSTFEENGLKEIVGRVQEKVREGEISNINELLDAICHTDFFTECPRAEQMDLLEFGSKFIDTIQESLDFELETSQEITRMIDPQDEALHAAQQEFFKRIYPVSAQNSDGTRSWTQNQENFFFHSQIVSAINAPAETLGAQLAKMAMPAIDSSYNKVTNSFVPDKRNENETETIRK